MSAVEELRAEARERSLRFLDFLEAYYSTFSPSVHSVQEYRDTVIRRQDVPEVPGVTLLAGNDMWLTCDLVVHAPVPTIPSELAPWVEEPVTAQTPPPLRHPDPVSRQLLRLLDDPPVYEGEPVDLDTLDQDQLTAEEIVGVPAGQVVVAAFAADDELQAAQRQLAHWVDTVWRP
jgi:hypothetical protein